MKTIVDFPGLFVGSCLALVLLAVGLDAGGCHMPAPVPPVPDASDAGWYGDASPTDPCSAAEARLRVLVCRFADGALVVPGLPGEWAESCRRARDDGRDWHPACQARIADCSQRDDAYRGRYCP
jgi:hypothetical protein